MSEETPNGKGRALATWDAFQAELRAHEHEIATLLPRHVSKERFMSSALAAVKQNPDLLLADPRSLFQAITQSAQDGLLPDGREGVITVYNEKQKDGSYKKKAKWNPMTWGLRKRARELEKLIIDCQVVHREDHFVWHQGDDPKLDHIPAKLGTPRGIMIGAYAIFKDEHGHILHREVMDAEQIANVRSQSRSADGLLWTKFAEEGWKKTALRRGIKSVPCTETLQNIVERDNDLYQFEERTPLAAVPAPPPPNTVYTFTGQSLGTPESKRKTIVPPSPKLEASPGSSPSHADAQGGAPKPPEGHSPAPEASAHPLDIPAILKRSKTVEEAEVIEGPQPFEAHELEDYLGDLAARFEQAPDRESVEEVKADFDESGRVRMFPFDIARAEGEYGKALERLRDAPCERYAHDQPQG